MVGIAFRKPAVVVMRDLGFGPVTLVDTLTGTAVGELQGSKEWHMDGWIEWWGSSSFVALLGIHNRLITMHGGTNACHGSVNAGGHEFKGYVFRKEESDASAGSPI